MELQGLLDLQLMMFVLMSVGYVLRKNGTVTKEGRSVLTDLIINVILPCNIITAFCIDFDRKILISGMQVLVISVVLQLFCTFLAAFAYRKVDKKKRMVLQYATVCSNAGFLGNPIAEGLYGFMGLLYASIYLIPQRIVMWSAGVSYFTESPSKRDVIKKVLKHPCIIAVEIGIIMMLTGFRFPEFLQRSVKSLGGCTTAITMLFIGTVLADAGLHNLLSRMTVLFSVVRLILIPFAVAAGCYLFHVGGTAAGLSVVLAGGRRGCPASPFSLSGLSSCQRTGAPEEVLCGW